MGFGGFESENGFRRAFGAVQRPISGLLEAGWREIRPFQEVKKGSIPCQSCVARYL
jgi:hypothetical protein